MCFDLQQMDKPPNAKLCQMFQAQAQCKSCLFCPRQKDIKKKICSLKLATKQGGEKAWEETASKNVSLACEEVALRNAPCLPVLPAGSSCYASEICFNQRNLNSQFKLSHLLPPFRRQRCRSGRAAWCLHNHHQYHPRDRDTRDGLLFFRVSVSVGFSLPFYLPAAVCVR